MKKVLFSLIVVVSLAMAYALYSVIGYLVVELGYPVLVSSNGNAYFGGNLIMLGVAFVVLVALAVCLAVLIHFIRKPQKEEKDENGGEKRKD